jgi:hypothetical protein
MAESNPMRWVVLSFVAAGAFAAGLIAYVSHATEVAKARAKADVEREFSQMENRGLPELDAAAAVAGPFIAHVGAGRFADAHALLAAPYRQAVSVEAFAKVCRTSPILTASRAVTLRSVRRQSAGGASTLEAQGVLDTSAGGVPVAFVFLSEAAGPRVLTLSIAGVPVIQGVALGR